MILEAPIERYPEITNKIIEVKDSAWWGKIPYKMTASDTLKWLCRLYQDEMSIVILSLNDDTDEMDGYIVAGLFEMDSPPHLRYVSERQWWGTDRKTKVKVWREAEQWGKDRGAVLSVYHNLAEIPIQEAHWRVL